MSNNQKPRHISPVAFIIASVVPLILFIHMRLINDPSKYEKCASEGWPENSCFSLGLEHFAIDAISALYVIIAVVLIIVAIIIYTKNKKK